MTNYKLKIKNKVALLTLIIMLLGIITLPAMARELPIKGKVNDTNITSLNIENANIDYYSESGSFEGTLNLEKLGKNTVWVKGLDDKGTTVASKRVRVLNLSNFKDVPQDYWAAKQIALISTLGILNGYPDQTFRPKRAITRAEMATILMRAKEVDISEPKMAIFKDVKLEHWAAKYITMAKRLGIIKGYPDGSFKPNANISRAEGLMMIARFANVDPETYENDFTDVASSHWIARTLAGAKKVGLVKYLGNKPFNPNQKLVRAESVEMLSRTQFAQQEIAELLSFDIGYEEVLKEQKLTEKELKKDEPKT